MKKLRVSWMTGLGILWLALFPLFSDCSYAHITHTKWVAMQAGLLLSLPALPLGLRRGRRLCWPALILALLLAAQLTASFLWGSHSRLPESLWGDRRYEGLLTQLGYILIFLCLAMGRGRDGRIRDAAAAALLLDALLCALQYTGVNPLGFYPKGFSIGQNYEFQGVIGNIDMGVGYLSLAVPLTLLPWVLRGGARRLPAALGGFAGIALLLLTEVQCGYFALGVLGLFLLGLALVRPETRCRAALTGMGFCLTLLGRLCLRLPWLDGSEAVTLAWGWSRGRIAALALAAACLAAALLLRRHPGRGWRLREAIPFCLSLPVLALALTAALPVPERMGGLWELHETLLGRGRDAFGSERLGIWRAAAALIREHPLWGTGPDTFLQAAREIMPSRGIFLRQAFDTPHCLPLALAAASGLPALGLFLALLAVCLRRCAKDGARGAVLAACILCWAAQSLFTFSVCLTSPMAWAVLGMAAAGNTIEEAKSYV